MHGAISVLKNSFSAELEPASWLSPLLVLLPCTGDKRYLNAHHAPGVDKQLSMPAYS